MKDEVKYIKKVPSFIEWLEKSGLLKRTRYGINYGGHIHRWRWWRKDIADYISYGPTVTIRDDCSKRDLQAIKTWISIYEERFPGQEICLRGKVVTYETDRPPKDLDGILGLE